MSAAIVTEDTLVIETPERVPLHFALASIGNRFLACTIDHAIQVITMIVMAIAFFTLANYSSLSDELTSAPKWVYAVLIIVLFLIVSGYFAFFEWLWNGQTPGKRWLKLRVIREDGRPVTFWEATVRNLLRSFDMMPAPFYSIGLISVFSTARDQRVGDLVAGTVVVRERETEAPAFTQVFETFLRRRWDLQDVPRQWMAWRVSLPIMYKLRPAYDVATFTYEGFLEELLHRYRATHRFIE
jgi:uncharacterized RDD family membrane protein YckC